MSHYREVCVFGIVHTQCRCPGPKSTTTIPCDRPTEHRGKLTEMHAANPALIPPPPSPFQPSDLVRNAHPSPRPFLGTVVPTPPKYADAADLVWVVFPDGHSLPSPLGFHPNDLRLAGTRCIPFEAMSAADQIDHLRLCHGLTFSPTSTSLARAIVHENVRPTHPHNHRKEPPAIMVCPGGQVAADHNGEPCCRRCGWNQPPPGYRTGDAGRMSFVEAIMHPHPDHGHPENAMYRPEGGPL